MTKYTVFNSDGDVLERGLTLAEAAQTMLTEDNHRYAIQQDADGGFSLWVSQFSAASTLGGRPLVKSVIFSLADSYEAAKAEIFNDIVLFGTGWNGLWVMTDDEYRDEIEVPTLMNDHF